MPIYEYECGECGCQTEILQKFSDPPITECEACNGKMRKLISQSTFHLKGTGWYVTDYASKSSSGSVAKSDETSKSESKPEVKSESKPSKTDEKVSTESAAKKEAS